MAAPNSVRSFFKSLSRPKSVSQYVCHPCIKRQVQLQQRTLHHRVEAPSSLPKPVPFVPDVSTFLTLIGRGMSAHAAKFTSWESLFRLKGPQLKELGIEPARARRYLLRWREKYRMGIYGIGGDFKHVDENGVGWLRVLEVPSLRNENVDAGGNSNEASTSRTPGLQELVLNTPKDTAQFTELLSEGQTSEDLRKPAFISLKDRHIIVGKSLQHVKGSNGRVAILKATEGLWEHKRGRKIYGGERRRAETLHKMRVEERKKSDR